jgi:hypothetical protein
MLSWANRTAGLWTSAAVNAVRQQQTAMLNALTRKPEKARPKRRRVKKRRTTGT